MKIVYEPYSFRNDSGAHGFRFCLRMDKPDHLGGICIQHGIVFGPVENIRPALHPFENDQIPLELAEKPLRPFPLCNVPELKPVYHEPRPARPRNAGPDSLEMRIYRARLEAYDRRQFEKYHMKGQGHV